MSRRVIALALALASAAGVAGCGTQDDAPRPTAMEASRMVTGLEELRGRVREVDDAGARAALRRVRDTVQSLDGREALEPAERRAVARSLARIERALARRPPPSRRDRPAPREPREAARERGQTTPIPAPVRAPAAAQGREDDEDDEDDEDEDEDTDGDD